MGLHYMRLDRAAYFKVSQQIDSNILKAVNQQTLANLHHRLASRVRHARYLADISPARWAKAVDEHEQIFNTLATRHGLRLTSILTQATLLSRARFRPVIAVLRRFRAICGPNFKDLINLIEVRDAYDSSFECKRRRCRDPVGGYDLRRTDSALY